MSKSRRREIEMILKCVGPEPVVDMLVEMEDEVRRLRKRVEVLSKIADARLTKIREVKGKVPAPSLSAHWEERSALAAAEIVRLRDEVEKLRAAAPQQTTLPERDLTRIDILADDEHRAACDAAALQQQIQNARDALEEIASGRGCQDGPGGCDGACREIAHKALAPSSPGDRGPGGASKLISPQALATIERAVEASTGESVETLRARPLEENREIAARRKPAPSAPAAREVAPDARAFAAAIWAAIQADKARFRSSPFGSGDEHRVREAIAEGLRVPLDCVKCGGTGAMDEGRWPCSGCNASGVALAVTTYCAAPADLLPPLDPSVRILPSTTVGGTVPLGTPDPRAPSAPATTPTPDTERKDG